MTGTSETYGKPRLTRFGPLLHQAGQARTSGRPSFRRPYRPGEPSEPGMTKSVDDHAARVVDFADPRPHFQADVAVAQHDRQEVDLRAERLVFDRGGAQALRHEDRDFAADVELGRPAADGDDVRLGQNLGDVVLLQRIEEAEERVVVADDAELARLAGGVDDGLERRPCRCWSGSTGR